MATCNPQDLLDIDPCYSTLNPFDLKVVQVGILCGIVDKLGGGSAPSCDIQTQLTDNKCLYSLTEPQLEVIMTQLLCEIANLV